MADMYQSVLMDADIHKTTEIGNIVQCPERPASLRSDTIDVFIKFKKSNFARGSRGLRKLLHDIL